MTTNNKNRSISLVGHPYAPTGRGEDMRSTYRALRSILMRQTLTDIYKLQSPDSDECKEFVGACVNNSSDINIFHINGDEVEKALIHLGQSKLEDGYNIVYPAWELEHYPAEWAGQLDRFDEIWAPSQFIKSSLEAACKKPVIHMLLACEVVLTSFLTKRYFGLSEEDYIFLFFFDIRSYVTRKNPSAVIESFHKLLKEKPYSKVRLVIKVNGAEQDAGVIQQLHNEVEDIAGHVSILYQVMTDNEIKNLVRCCDCFVSLHRSEGFGRGIAEAMCLGKPVIATAYSGNMDFMTRDTSLEVGYQLVQVEDNKYPYWKNQSWANADVVQASMHMMKLIDDPSYGYELGRRAKLHIHKTLSYQVSGSKYRERLEYIEKEALNK